MFDMPSFSSFVAFASDMPLICSNIRRGLYNSQIVLLYLVWYLYVYAIDSTV